VFRLFRPELRALAEPNSVREKSSSFLNLRYLTDCAMIRGDETSSSINAAH
jgi:hypothetical protein